MNLETLLSIEPFHWHSIAACLFCGFIIGLERQLRGKPVGIRTSSLIVLGTYIFVSASFYVSINATVSDPSRIIGQVVTGIGFLGAGVMLAKDGSVLGVTSAATIWSLAAIGVCVSVVSELTAIKLSLIIVAILAGVDTIEEYSTNVSRDVHQKFSKWKRRR